MQVDRIEVDELAAAVGVADFVRIPDGKDSVISGRGDVKDVLLWIVGQAGRADLESCGVRTMDVQKSFPTI